MAKIKLIIDSTSYVSKQFTIDNNIEVVPLTCHYKKGEFEEMYVEDAGAFYKEYIATNDLLTTSQPSPEKFLTAYNKFLAEGYEIIVITMASTLSGTHNSAILAQKDCGSDLVSVIDSGAVCQGIALYIEIILDMIAKGASRLEIVEKINAIKVTGTMMFVPATMTYLKRGGRLGVITATVAEILQIKPILMFKNGALSVAKKALGMKRAIAEVVNLIPQAVKKLFVVVVNESESFNILVDKLAIKFPSTEIIKGKIGPVYGSHVGPGCVGVAFIG